MIKCWYVCVSRLLKTARNSHWIYAGTRHYLVWLPRARLYQFWKWKSLKERTRRIISCDATILMDILYHFWPKHLGFMMAGICLECLSPESVGDLPVFIDFTEHLRFIWHLVFMDAQGKLTLFCVSASSIAPLCFAISFIFPRTLLMGVKKKKTFIKTHQQKYTFQQPPNILDYLFYPFLTRKLQ